ncbi:hypothetical protein E3U55_16670 [Filobacillus milosensis]|uniref:Uncharacterized protein n=1 Tax=Filobacillus milosensis TaxID=94137 RepID=A0A4Y8IBC1_9BACI|nr:hypothetical protein [Filobacillus milosensis]TFB13119.1 hypothetical protein E3U55_16670 [Filobacillus milosensis]
MIQNQFLIQDQKNKPIKLRAKRVAYYVRGQIIEAMSDNEELYYLFYYQNHFLTAKKTSKLRRGSYIENAFKRGHIYDAPHPFINTLITSNQTSKILNNKQLLRKLNQQYSSHDKAYILTFFESFISKKQLFEEIKSMFYELRRNGQLFSAYQLICILKDFAPNHSLVKSLSSDLIYKDFSKMYYDRTEEFFRKDPIEAEKIMFSEQDRYAEQYVSKLKADGRKLELLVWQYEHLKNHPQEELYNSFFNELQPISDHEKIQILEQLINQNHFLPIQEDLFKLYIKTNQFDKVAELMTTYEMDISEQDLEEVTQLLLESPQKNIDVDQLQPLLLKVTEYNHALAEDLLYKYIGAMLQKHDLFYIKKWLEPFKDHSAVIQKFGKLYQLNEDLDHMQTLGELYYEFKHWDQAIECFSMESELKPDEALPLKWLSKTYLEKGMKEESDVYQKMFVNVQKQA